MSAESLFREPSSGERRLLELLTSRCTACVPDWLANVRVRPMNDEGMGSLRLTVPAASALERTMGSRVAEFQFDDEDGVRVVASLNTDQHGLPFELDIWKTDFSALVRFPDSLNSDEEID